MIFFKETRTGQTTNNEVIKQFSNSWDENCKSEKGVRSRIGNFTHSFDTDVSNEIGLYDHTSDSGLLYFFTIII